MDGVLERLVRAIALAAGVAVAAAGCATVAPPCTKVPIVVAKKEIVSRVETRRGTPRTSTRGSGEETEEAVRVVEYRVAGEDGTWYRVTEAEYEATAPQQRLEVCR